MEELEALKAETAEAFYQVFQQVEGQTNKVKHIMADLLVEKVIELFLAAQE